MAEESWDNISKRLAEQADLQNKITSSASEYAKFIRDIGVLQENLNKLKKNETELLELLNEAEKAGNEEDKKKYKSLLKYNQQQQKALSKQLKQYKEINGEVNKLAIVSRSIVSTWANLPNLADKYYSKLKNLAAVQMSKDIKQAELSMGILNGQSKFFSKTISTASESTIQLGVGVSDLAKGQADYSAEIGRSVMLSEAGYEAMAQMARGTTLGMQGAAQMAGDMERFGLSVESSRDAIQETVDIAHSMGVNAEKAIKGLGKNLKIANTYHFKGGVNGMAEMAVYAEKMKVDMGSIASMAGKVFRPEGAVEMAARLQTMGGSFARLGNPFELMFKARNDFGAFTKDVANATAELAQFNESTGEFEISGLQLDRLREIATITGIGEEQLSEMARQAAKFNRVKSLIPGVFTDEADKELISSIAQMGDDGEYFVRINGDDLKLNELNNDLLNTFKEEKKTLAERAKEAQTFDDAFNNLVLQFKSVLLPFVEELNDYFVPAIQKFNGDLVNSGLIQQLKDMGESAGKVIVGVGKIVMAFEEYLGPKGVLAAFFGGKLLFDAAKWYQQGKMLRMGFNSVGGGFDDGGGDYYESDSGSKGKRGKKSRRPKPKKGFKGGAGRLFDAAKGGGAKGFGKSAFKLIKSGAKSNAITAGLFGLADAGMSLASGEDPKDALLRAAFSTGGSLLGGTLGSLIAPGAGTVAGGMAGGYAGDALYDKLFNVDDAIIKFNPQDKIVSMDDGLVASTSKGKIDELFQGRGIKKHKIKFGKLDIGGKITLEMPGATTMDIDLTREPEFVRKLSTMIQEQLRTNLAGGKLSPNPIPRYDN